MKNWEIGQSNTTRMCSRQIFKLCSINSTAWTADLKTFCRGRDYILNLSKFMSKSVLTLCITIDARQNKVLWMKELHPLCCCQNQSSFSTKETSQEDFFFFYTANLYKMTFFPIFILLQNATTKLTGPHLFMM